MNLQDALLMSTTKQAVSAATVGSSEDDGPPLWTAKLTVVSDFADEDIYGVIEIMANGGDRWVAFADLDPITKEGVVSSEWKALDEGHPLLLLASESDDD